tara:strand:- start:97 stop:270 length:174 start_codon:yes stop_codon:yes gene_type:complete
MNFIIFAIAAILFCASAFHIRDALDDREYGRVAFFFLPFALSGLAIVLLTQGAATWG